MIYLRALSDSICFQQFSIVVFSFFLFTRLAFWQGVESEQVATEGLSTFKKSSQSQQASRGRRGKNEKGERKTFKKHFDEVWSIFGVLCWKENVLRAFLSCSILCLYWVGQEWIILKIIYWGKTFWVLLTLSVPWVII